eukprot:8097151-Pyramimonas_sp.AAC.2
MGYQQNTCQLRTTADIPVDVLLFQGLSRKQDPLDEPRRFTATEDAGATGISFTASCEGRLTPVGRWDAYQRRAPLRAKQGDEVHHEVEA